MDGLLLDSTLTKSSLCVSSRLVHNLDTAVTSYHVFGFPGPINLDVRSAVHKYVISSTSYSRYHSTTLPLLHSSHITMSSKHPQEDETQTLVEAEGTYTFKIPTLTSHIPVSLGDPTTASKEIQHYQCDAVLGTGTHSTPSKHKPVQPCNLIGMFEN